MAMARRGGFNSGWVLIAIVTKLIVIYNQAIREFGIFSGPLD